MTSIHIHNLQYYILLFFYLFEICFSINLLGNHNSLIKIDNYVFYYISITLGLYTIFIIGIITIILKNYMYYMKYKAFRQNDLFTIYILLTLDLFLNLIYFFFSNRFKDYKAEYMGNIIFSIYIIPKLLLGIIILVLYISFCIFLIIQMIDYCCCSNLMCNLVEYCKGNRNTIRNYESDDEGEDTYNNREHN